MKRNIVAQKYDHLTDADLDAMLMQCAEDRLRERVAMYQEKLAQDRARIQRDMAITRRVIRGESGADIAPSYSQDFKPTGARCVIAALARRFVGM